MEQKNCKLQEVKWGGEIYGKQRLFVGWIYKSQTEVFKLVGQVKCRDALSFNKKSPGIVNKSLTVSHCPLNKDSKKGVVNIMIKNTYAPSFFQKGE